MDMQQIPGFLLTALEVASFAFIFVIGQGLLAAIISLYVVDKTQRRQAIRHNYPVIGRFLYPFERVGGCATARSLGSAYAPFPWARA